MRRRKKRRRRRKANMKLDTNINQIDPHNYDCEELKLENENDLQLHTKADDFVKISGNEFSVNNSSNLCCKNVATQTANTVYKEIGLQFPEEETTPPKSVLADSRRKSSPKHRIKRLPTLNKKRHCHPHHHCCFRSNSCKSASRPTQHGSQIRTTDGVKRILVRLRNNTLSISKVFLHGFISIVKLMEICLELSFNAKRKLSSTCQEIITSYCRSDLMFDKKLDNISRDISSLKKVIGDECKHINRRIDDIDQKQKHLEHMLVAITTTNVKSDSFSASVVAQSNPVAFVPPPPPPLPPPPLVSTVMYNGVITVQNNTKRSISNIHVYNNKHQERVAITVEDIRNVKLRSRSTKDCSAMEKQEPFIISQQMLNGVKLKRT